MRSLVAAPNVISWDGFARCAALCAALVSWPGSGGAQDIGTLNPQPLPPVAKPDDPKIPAKELFGRKTTPAPLEARTIGFYAKGCLAGAVALPVNGQTWQVMRVSRNRNWGHPKLVEFLERLAGKAPQTGWRGLLVGIRGSAVGRLVHDRRCFFWGSGASVGAGTVGRRALVGWGAGSRQGLRKNRLSG